MKKKSLLKEIINDREDICLLYSWGNEAKKEIQRAHDRHTHHINDHRANDLLPQFTALCKEVETLKKQGPHTCHNHPALIEDRRRIIELEDSMAGLWEKGTDQDGNILAMLKSIPDIEILKVQVKELEADRKKLFPHSHTPDLDAIYAKMKEQRSDYHGHIRQLVTENEAAHLEMKKRYDMMESADCANLDRLNKKMDCYSAELSQVAADTNKALLAIRQTNNVARECSNAQATEITNLKKEMEQLRKAARLQGEHIVELEKKYCSCNDSERLFKGEPLKGDSTTPADYPCETCKNKCTPNDYEPCNSCRDGEKWGSKKAKSKKGE
jgi:uncharacterized coiled-coil DUF342 family protein